MNQNSKTGLHQIQQDNFYFLVGSDENNIICSVDFIYIELFTRNI